MMSGLSDNRGSGKGFPVPPERNLIISAGKLRCPRVMCWNSDSVILLNNLWFFNELLFFLQCIMIMSGLSGNRGSGKGFPVPPDRNLIISAEKLRCPRVLCRNSGSVILLNNLWFSNGAFHRRKCLTGGQKLLKLIEFLQKKYPDIFGNRFYEVFFSTKIFDFFRLF